MKWISVKEPPKKQFDRILLGHREEKWVTEGTYEFFEGEEIWSNWDGDKHPTHWMPLPSPPKE